MFFMYTELPTVLGEVWKFSAKFLLLAKLANVSIIVQYMLHSLLVCTEVHKAYFKGWTTPIYGLSELQLNEL